MKYDRPSGTTKSHRGSLSPMADGSAEAVKFQYFMRYNSPKQSTRHAAQMLLFRAAHGGLCGLIRRGTRVLLFEQQSRQPRESRDQHEPDGAFDAANQVKDHACQQQHDPLRPLRNQIIQHDACRDEPHKGQGGKGHLSSDGSR